MKTVKKVLLFPVELVKITFKGFYYLCSLLAKGFYFYLAQVSSWLAHLLPKSFFPRLANHFKKRQHQPEYFLLLVLYVVAFSSLFNLFYVKPDTVIYHDDTELQVDDEKSTPSEEQPSERKDDASKQKKVDSNLFRQYGSTKLEDVDFTSLKKKNPDVVAWLSVDGTSINYPIVQTSDNEFYLNHTFDRTFKNSGWTFMDYRNQIETDANTIFYGHNLLNKTAFGSIANIFTPTWLNSSSHTIIVLTETKKYIYRIFSAYYSDPETYYLQTEFTSPDDYYNFLKTLQSRSIVPLNEQLQASERIITLSTCTEDNAGRKVVHAKLITESSRS